VNLILVEEPLTCVLSELEPCLTASLSVIQKSLSEINFNSAIADRSNSMRRFIKEQTEKIKGFEWIPKTRDGQAPFYTDAKYICNGECRSLHVLNVVICLSNREAIGTNFLKLELAALSEIRKYHEQEVLDSNILGILLTFDRDVLSLGKWDPAYADSSEYSGAIRKFYKPFLRSNIVNLRIHQ
jgi:hypothetical protein